MKLAELKEIYQRDCPKVDKDRLKSEIIKLNDLVVKYTIWHAEQSLILKRMEKEVAKVKSPATRYINGSMNTKECQERGLPELLGRRPSTIGETDLHVTAYMAENNATADLIDRYDEQEIVVKLLESMVKAVTFTRKETLLSYERLELGGFIDA